MWCSLRKLEIVEWLVKVVQAMYRGTVNKVRVGHGYSNEFSVQAGVCQSSILLLLDVTEEYNAETPWESLCCPHSRICKRIRKGVPGVEPEPAVKGVLK